MKRRLSFVLALLLTSFALMISACRSNTNFISPAPLGTATPIPPTATATAVYPFVTQWGESTVFNGSNGIAVDTSGNVYEADTLNDRIQRFTTNGTPITLWGTSGNAPGLLNKPLGVAVNPAGSMIYVADSGNNRVEVYNPVGAYLFQWGGPAASTLTGQFNYPTQLGVDFWGNVYVVDNNNQRIQKFSFDGSWLKTWGSSGTGDGQFNFPYGIAVYSNSGGTTVYVSDKGSNRIQAFDVDGKYLFQWGGPAPGTGNGQFTGNNSLAVDVWGNVYAADGGAHVQKFTSKGTFLTKWGNFGGGNNIFNTPSGVAVDYTGYVYVADSWYNKIQVFAPY